MYVNEENLPLIAPTAVVANKPSRVWPIIATCVALTTIGFAVVAVNGGLSSPSASSSEDSTKKLQMVQTGSLMYGSLSDGEKSTLFDTFKSDFGREYATKAEEKERYSHFKYFLSKVDARNAAEQLSGGSAVHGVTQFSDLSTKEFKARYLGYIPSTGKSKAAAVVMEEFDNSVTSVSWADKYTTPVKNQGYCGSCWAFSSTEQIESDSIRAGITTTKTALSTQQIVSCDTTENGIKSSYANYGCEGGFTETAYEYVMAAGGITTEALYPYTSYYATTGTCITTKNDYLVTVDSFHVVADEKDMENYVLNKGPLSVCLDASDWSSYKSGIVSVCGTDVDHCVQVVGVNMDDGYWIVRNSWGTSWGLAGYIWLKTGSNTCDITYSPTYVSVSAV